MRLNKIAYNARSFTAFGVAFAMLLSMSTAAVVTAAQSGDDVLHTVTIIVDGQSWEYSSYQKTVGGILKEAGIGLGSKDRAYPKLKAKPTQGMQIKVTRIVDEVVVQKEPIAFKKSVKFDMGLSGGKVLVQQGVPGEKEVKYLVTYKDGVKVSCKSLGSKVTKAPVKEITAVSRGMILASRAGSYKRVMRMHATAYDPGPRSCGKYADGYTANGMKAQKGVVAVDPRVIRLGTKLYVEGYGFCIAADTGGAIKGNRIDLCYNTYAEAIRFGRRTVTVYVLE